MEEVFSRGGDDEHPLNGCEEESVGGKEKHCSMKLEVGVKNVRTEEMRQE